jgi:HAD superfamily hydrolase (TIGR01484 family)
MKIIASDFDGTLNFHGVSAEDSEAIAKFRAKGHKFGIVTGRDLEMALWVLFDLKKANAEIDFLICCTGAVILNGKGELLMVKKGKVTPEFQTFIDKAYELGFGGFNFNNLLKRCYLDSRGNVPSEAMQIGEFTQLNIWFPDDKNSEKFNAFINENYSHLISSYRNGGSIDMPPVNTSKVTGIYDYSKQFDNPEIYSVGDNLNDLPMIEEFCGFAVSNAQPEVKAVAKHQCNRICDMINYILEEEDK